jgi:hypothetical protein
MWKAYGPNDLGAIIASSGRRELATEFTSNRGRLLASAARFEGGFPEHVQVTFPPQRVLRFGDGREAVTLRAARSSKSCSA